MSKKIRIFGGLACLLTFLGGGIPPAGALEKQPAPATLAEAYIYAYPLYEIARTRYAATWKQPAENSALNRLVHRRTLSDHTDRWVTTPNNDTLYSSAFLDLSQSPVEISTPDFADRYFSIAFLDAFTNNFATIGRRTTGTAPQHYLVVGPHWHGTAPADAKLIRAPGNWVWVLVRTLIQDKSELALVHRLQDGITLRAVQPFAARPPVVPVDNDAENFIAVVNQALAENPPPAADRALLERIAAVGIKPGAGLPEAGVVDAWKAAFPQLRQRLIEAGKSARPTEVRHGWSYNPKNLGNFGSDYAYRALVALVGLAALEPSEAVYSSAVTDQNGAPLRGDRRYRWHLPAAGLPVDAFWSLSAYEVAPSGALFFADNAIHRYAIGDRSEGLVKNADGSLDILIQHVPPAERASNWLPIPEGPVRLVLRAYQPRPEVLQGKYDFPTIELLP